MEIHSDGYQRLSRELKYLQAIFPTKWSRVHPFYVCFNVDKRKVLFKKYFLCAEGEKNAEHLFFFPPRVFYLSIIWQSRQHKMISFHFAFYFLWINLE